MKEKIKKVISWVVFSIFILWVLASFEWDHFNWNNLFIALGIWWLISTILRIEKKIDQILNN